MKGCLMGVPFFVVNNSFRILYIIDFGYICNLSIDAQGLEFWAFIERRHSYKRFKILSLELKIAKFQVGQR